MLWMLLVYVIGSNGYAGQPVMTSSFHGATYPTKAECAAAASSVGLYKSSSEVDDIAKVGLVLVCAPVSPAPVAPPPQAAAEPVQSQSPFPPYPPAPLPRKK
ncbi:MAG: hypothetical protein WDN08_21190 [Rhizomicrobium sp.]